VITKVKHSKGQTTIRWRDVRQEEIVEHELKSSEEPRPELLTSIAAFVPFVIEICEFPKGWADEIAISGVSLSEVELKDGKQIGIVITAQKRLELTPSPVIINTPFLIDEAWPKGLQKAVEKLDQEAVRFRSGDRAQQELPIAQNHKKQGELDEVVKKTADAINAGLLDKGGTTVRAEVRR